MLRGRNVRYISTFSSAEAIRERHAGGFPWTICAFHCRRGEAVSRGSRKFSGPVVVSKRSATEEQIGVVLFDRSAAIPTDARRRLLLADARNILTGLVFFAEARAKGCAVDWS